MGPGDLQALGQSSRRRSLFVQFPLGHAAFQLVEQAECGPGIARTQSPIRLPEQANLFEQLLLGD
jgi:hypothetical protein